MYIPMQLDSACHSKDSVAQAADLLGRAALTTQAGSRSNQPGRVTEQHVSDLSLSCQSEASLAAITARHAGLRSSTYKRYKTLSKHQEHDLLPFEPGRAGSRSSTWKGLYHVSHHSCTTCCQYVTAGEAAQQHLGKA